MLSFFTQIFVQDDTSIQLLYQHGITQCLLGGDTRFDRVTQIAGRSAEIPGILSFLENKDAIVAGSTWPEDEKILSAALKYSNLKLIVAPHNIDTGHLQQIQSYFEDSVKYSELRENDNHFTVLIIDNVGMLSRLYKYGRLTYVGGGFTKDGIHNILEAAVYGKPIIIGKNYKKYKEAKELVAAGGAFSIANEIQLKNIFQELTGSKTLLKIASEASLTYISKNTGATEKILHYIQANRLLTN
ncbi:MAG: hypothetical protein NVSMB67_17920 [Flavisolibacter sp.]